MIVQAAELVFEHGPRARAVSVVVPLYNYAGFIAAALDAVAAQSFRDLALVVVDDASRDDSLAVVRDWMAAHRGDGISLALLRHSANARLATTRNTGIAFARSPLCFFLDADNALYPRCIEKHAAALGRRPDAVAAYGLIEVFGGRAAIIGAGVFHRDGLRHRNFIDAMAMVRRETLLAMGGYRHIEHGWEDYDLWLRLCEGGQTVLHIPEILSRYREHAASMLRAETNRAENIRRLHAEMTRLHPWLDLA